jgi:cytochrome b involved in lipid metabolism
MYCDQNPNIIKWASEAVQIEYWNPIDKKTHTYHPDYYIKVQKKDGSTEDWIIEIKPSAQYQLDKKPVLKEPMTEKRIRSHNEQMQTWIVNRAKFDAAMNFAKYNGYRFGAIDENFIFR